MLFKKYLSLALVAVTASTFTLPTNIVFANDNIIVQSNVLKKRVFSSWFISVAYFQMQRY